MLLLTILTQNECHQVKARGSWRIEVYVRTFAGARSETSAHYNTGLGPVLTLQSHGLIEFLLLCVTAASVIPVLPLIIANLHTV